jgi:hypothetical protein
LELKAKCEAIEKRESERRAMEERKHAEEIAFLKKTNVQLKVFAIDHRHNWKVFFHHKRSKFSSNKAARIP